MDPAFDLMTHKLGRPQTLAQYYDPKRYPVEKQQQQRLVENVEIISRDPLLYRGAQPADMDSSYPYQYSGHQYGVRGHPEEVKQRLTGAQQNFGPHSPRHGSVQDYSQLTAMQQRQEYMQRVAQHQQQLLQREHLDRVAEQNKMAAARVVSHETGRSPRNIHGYGEHYEHMSPRNSAFTYTSAASAQQHGKRVKIERRPSVDSVHSAGYSSHQPTQAMMAARGMNPRQYQEHYAAAAQGQVANHPRDLAASKAAQEQLREWEAQADQMYAKYAVAAAAGNDREIPSNRNYQSPISPTHQDVPPEQLDAQLARFKTIVQSLENLKEQQRNKYKSSAFQYLEKYGAAEAPSQALGAQQTTASTPSKKNYQFHNMRPPPHQHISSPPKFTEKPSPQKSPGGRYLNPSVEHQQQQMAYYQQQYQASQQRRHQQAGQGRHQHPPSATYKKDVSPMQMLSQGLPKIVDVRSLANGTAATVVENSAAALNRRRRSSEPFVVDNRSVRMRSDSSLEGYVYEISDTRSADSCDSGLEPLASPDAHLYNRNAIALAQQQQQLEAAKAQHAASIEAMKCQNINRQQTRNQANAPNVRLERAGSPRKLSEIMEKDKVCPSMFKGIDSLICKCQACLLHQEKTEIQIRDLYRERKIKRLSGSTAPSSKPPSTATSATASHNSSQPQSEVILIEDDEKGDFQKRSASSESQPDAKRMKMTDTNDNIVALDLSKKTVTSKPEESKPDNVPLDLKVQPKTLSNIDVKKFATGRHGDLTVEQVIASCIRSAEERISNCEKSLLRQGETTTSFEQIITQCIDRECLDKGEQVKRIKNDVHSMVEELKKDKSLSKDKPPQPGSAQNLAVYSTDSSKEKMETNTNVSKDDVEMLNQDEDCKGEATSCKDIKDNSKEQKRETLKRKPSTGHSIDDMALLQNQVVLTDLKVMIPKLKVNSDMIVPTGDDSQPEEQVVTALHRTASVPLLKTGADDSDTIQRARSVGLSNTMSKVMETTEGYPKSRSDFVKDGLNERPSSAPSCETITESHKDSLNRKQELVPKPQGSQHIPYIPKNLRDCFDEKTKPDEGKNKIEMQRTLKSPAFMSKNLKECWVGGDDKKAKDLASPKMQWKAQWAKEKQFSKKADESLCEVCGTTSSSVSHAACQHQSSSMDANKIETPQNLVKEKDADRNKETGKTISLQALFQSKQFQHAVNATIKPLLEGDDKPDRAQTTNANQVEHVHPLPIQTSSLALIKGKQQGKATIFHKQPEKKSDQIQKPVNLKQNDSTNDGVTTVKKESKFPRLAPSPTAAMESSYEVHEHSAPVSGHDCMVTQPAVQVPIRNVLRVMPNVQTPVSSLQTSAASTAVGMVGVGSKPQNVQVNIMTPAKSSVLEPIVEESPPIIHDQLQDTHTRAQTQGASSVAKTAAATQPAEHFSRTQSPAIPPLANTSMVLSSSEGLIDLSKTSRENRPMSTPKPNQSKPPVGEDLTKSSEQFATPTSRVQPMIPTTTTTSVAQIVAVKPKTSVCNLEAYPIALSKSVSQSVKESIVTEKASSKPEASVPKEPMQMVCAGETRTTTSIIPHLKPPLEETTLHHLHCSPPVFESSIETSSEQAIVNTMNEQPIDQVSSAPSVVHVQTSAGQMAQVTMATSMSTMQGTNTRESDNVTQASAVGKPPEIQQLPQKHLKTLSPVVTLSDGIPHLDNVKDQQLVQQVAAADQPLSLVTRPSGSLKEQLPINLIAKTIKIPQSQPSPLPKMPALIPTSMTTQPPPLLLISSGPSAVKPTPGQRPLLPTPMKIQVAQPVVPVSTVTFVASPSPCQPVVTMQSAVLTPSSAPVQPVVTLQSAVLTPSPAPVQQVLTPSSAPVRPVLTLQSAMLTPSPAPVQQVLTPSSAPIRPVVTMQSAVMTPSSVPVQPVLTPSSTPVKPVVTMPSAILTPPKEPSPQLQLVDDVENQQQDLPSESKSDKTECDLDMILPLPLEKVNRRLKSSAPHIHVPTDSGYSRYQKDSNNMREIYRMEVNDDLQPLDLKVSPKKTQTISASKVIYLQHSFPCVIRSEVPFVSPQMLQEAFFAAVDYSNFNYALQKCGILHRYMTMQEQGAMSRACVTRTWNGSCKLIPLDEFDSKFEQITTLLEQGEEEQKS